MLLVEGTIMDQQTDAFRDELRRYRPRKLKADIAAVQHEHDLLDEGSFPVARDLLRSYLAHLRKELLNC